jgi:hypothetical protein
MNSIFIFRQNGTRFALIPYEAPTNPMFPKLIETESKLNQLLPANRPEESPPAGLMQAAANWSHTVWAEAERLGPMPLSYVQINQGRILARKPVYVCGVHRSGTTLVRDMLDSHPDLVVLPSEGTFYTNLERKVNNLPEYDRAAFLGQEWLRRLANPINQPPYWLLGCSSNKTSPYIDFARYVLAWWAVVDTDNKAWPHLAIALAYASITNNLTAQYWVDKTPANERYLERIWNETPEAKVIHVIREPLATLASRKKMEPAISMRNALADLNISFRVATNQPPENDTRYLLLRYEDICTDPGQISRQIANFLVIEPDEILNTPTVAGKPAQPNSSFNKKAPSGSIMKPDQHPQQDVLSPDEQELAAACIGEVSAKLSYPIGTVGTLRKWQLKLQHHIL